ncbi:MAG: (4Fe-4S)-binding protein [Saprospiraceae bacterium]|nr:(4Fe-4S)-binding protein [Saprospiraceae bacterium]
MTHKTYKKGDLSVIWKPDLCIHSANCVKGLPAVFDNRRRPWINLEEADREAIMRQVEKCPSGALSFTLENKDLLENQQGHIVQVIAISNGPLQVNSTCEIVRANGEKVLKEQKSFFCRCGGSSNKPFCDGTHKKIGFQD